VNVKPAHRPVPRIASGLADFYWLRVPRRLARASPTVAAHALDGSYLSRHPMAGALSPPAAAALGLVLGAAHPGPTYSRSVIVMGLLVATGFVAASLGMAALVGYAVGDLFLHGPIDDVSGVDRLVPLLITYAVMAFVVVLAPTATTAIRSSVRRAVATKLGDGAGATLIVTTVFGAAVAGLLVYTWTRSAAVLIRPVFTWHGSQPEAPDIRPLQTGRVWALVAAAIAATVARAVAEERLRLRARHDPRHEALAVSVALRAHVVAADPARRISSRVAAGVATAFVLSGMIAGFVQGVLVAAFFTAVLLARDALNRSGARAVRLFQKVPAIVRFALAFLVARQVVESILSRAWDSGSRSTFEPLLYATCAAAAIVTVLSGRRPAPELALFTEDVARRTR